MHFNSTFIYAKIVIENSGDDAMRVDDERRQKEKKSGNPLLIFIIFVTLLSFVFIIPDVYKKINADFQKELELNSSNQNNLEPQEENDINSVSEYYQIGSNDILTYNEITISNVDLNDNILAIDINTSNNIDLTDLNYYIEFYQEKSTFLGRRILRGEVNKTKKISIDLTGLNIDSTTYFVISHIKDESIPKFSLNTDESGIGSITCTKNNKSYLYDFSLDALVRVLYKYTYENTDLNNYSDELLKYQKLAKEYNNLNGITALIAENNTEFVYTLELDYSDIQTFNKVNDDYKFKKGEYSYIIKFKMDAEGFTCV